MQQNSKYASCVTYSPREDSILKNIDRIVDEKYPSKNEIFSRGLHCFTYLWNVDENSQFNLLHSLFEKLSLDLDKQTLGMARDLAFSTQSILVTKYGLGKADSFTTIPITLENISNSLEGIDTITDEIKTDVEKTVADLDTILQTVFNNSDKTY